MNVLWCFLALLETISKIQGELLYCYECDGTSCDNLDDSKTVYCGPDLQGENESPTSNTILTTTAIPLSSNESNTEALATFSTIFSEVPVNSTQSTTIMSSSSMYPPSTTESSNLDEESVATTDTFTESITISTSVTDLNIMSTQYTETYSTTSNVDSTIASLMTSTMAESDTENTFGTTLDYTMTTENITITPLVDSSTESNNLFEETDGTTSVIMSTIPESTTKDSFSTISDKTTTSDSTLTVNTISKIPEARIVDDNSNHNNIRYACYKINYNDIENNHMKVNKGCISIRKNETGCGAVKEYMKNATGSENISSCYMCSTNKCNAASVTHLSIMLIVIIYTAILIPKLAI